MKELLNSKLFKVSLLLLFLGMFFLILENIFYQSIDHNGVLHESFFMPLGILSLLLAFLSLAYGFIQKIIR